MLSSAILAARDPRLEYVQLVSFGCGHDAYLSDEIIRVMKEISGKTPLALKVDESDVQGPLRIRVRSFVETLNMKRELKKKQGETLQTKELGEPSGEIYGSGPKRKSGIGAKYFPCIFAGYVCCDEGAGA